MALSSSSTETDACNQFYDNVEGWRGSQSKASALVAAMDWLLLKHKASELSDQGSKIVLSDTFNTLYKQASEYVAGGNSSRGSMFSRTRVQNMGGA